MTGWLEELPSWAIAWAALRESASVREGAGVRITAAGDDDDELIVGWPGPDADQAAKAATGQPGSILTLVAEDRAPVLAFAADHGLEPSRQGVLLSAPTAALETSSPLPESAGLESAPLDEYDVVQAIEFGHPVASGRLRIEDGIGVIGGLKCHRADPGSVFSRAVLAALVDEAFVHGAETLYTVVTERQASGYEAVGWTVVAHVLSCRAAG